MQRRLATVIAAMAGCGAPAAVAPAPVTAIAPPADKHLLATDPDLAPPHARPLVDVDWSTVSVASNDDALALWRRIAPTGDDWERKLDEVPVDGPAARALAAALLRGGNLTCGPAPHAPRCAPVPADAAPPAPTAGFGDPCLRRLLALWSIQQLDATAVHDLRDQLRAIAALPPPESELVAAAIEVVPEADQDERLAMLTIADRAGQHDVIDAELPRLDPAHLELVATQLHVPLALDMLAAEDHRALFLHAIADDKMPTDGRIKAISELASAAPDLAADVRAALATATQAADCAVAARAARELDGFGDHRFVPRRPRGLRTTAQLQRALCVLASYEHDQPADEASLWPSYVPAYGVERVDVAYDPLAEAGSDDPSTTPATRTFTVEPHADAVLPEIDDLVRAMTSCTTDAATIACTSATRVFKIATAREAGELVVRQLEVDEKPPCRDSDVSP